MKGDQICVYSQPAIQRIKMTTPRPSLSYPMVKCIILYNDYVSFDIIPIWFSLSLNEVISLGSRSQGYYREPQLLRIPRHEFLHYRCSVLKHCFSSRRTVVYRECFATVQLVQVSVNMTGVRQSRAEQTQYMIQEHDARQEQVINKITVALTMHLISYDKRLSPETNEVSVNVFMFQYCVTLSLFSS